jgi:hypothetical protein
MLVCNFSFISRAQTQFQESDLETTLKKEKQRQDGAKLPLSPIVSYSRTRNLAHGCNHQGF